jgi:hypothetical protein
MNNICNIFTQEYVTLMKDIENTVEIKAYDRFKYFNIWMLEINLIRLFLYNLDDESIYTIIPFVTISCKLKDPILILSKQFLVTRNSNSVTIYDFIYKQMEIAKVDFNIGEVQCYNIYFKFRKVELFKKSPK